MYSIVFSVFNNCKYSITHKPRGQTSRLKNAFRSITNPFNPSNITPLKQFFTNSFSTFTK